MTPLRGWSAKGKRLHGYAPHRQWKTSTFLAGLRRHAITAPFVFEGPINGEIFKTYVADVLVPTLRPGDIVVLDNLGSHKGRAIRELVRKAGARVWFLPPYSPDLNPIEQVFTGALLASAMSATTLELSTPPERNAPTGTSATIWRSTARRTWAVVPSTDSRSPRSATTPRNAGS